MTNTYATPRSAHQLVMETFGLYRRYPVLFLILAVGVVVPYEVAVLVVTGVGPLARGSLGFGVTTALTAVDWFLVTPLISALHVHAVAEAGAGNDPQLGSILGKGVRVLPVVVAAAIVSGVGIWLGLLALAFPGIILMIRWCVVAQEAAIEHEGWLPALRRSGQLAADHYGHIFILIMYAGIIASVPTILVGLFFGHDSTTAASFSVGVLVAIFAYSFAALTTALLYFDLRGRFRPSAALASPADGVSPGDGPPPIGLPWDAASYSDQDRPSGWYVDPEAPRRMCYWSQGESPGWGVTTRTPRKIRRAWQAKGEVA